MELEWLGPYQLVRKLGQGGMGVVYEGVDVETGERAALKVLSAPLSQEEDFRTRFETEIETLRRLKHRNIVRLFGFGQQEGLLFYAMELVDGPSLQSELRRGRRFGWQQVVQIGLQICRGLRHAHDRGVIHRDLKPGNLLLASDGTVKLADFGIAQLFGRSRLTAVGSVVGTLDYMAPEQAQGGLVDARADLYSLGGVLYALLSGRPPLRARTLAEMLEKLHNTRPESIRQLVPEVPEGLEELLEQLLEKEPQRRIATAQIAARRLETLLQEANSPQSFAGGLPEPASEELFPAPGVDGEKSASLPGLAEPVGASPPPSAEGQPEEKLSAKPPEEAFELPETKPMTCPGSLSPSRSGAEQNLLDGPTAHAEPPEPSARDLSINLSVSEESCFSGQGEVLPRASTQGPPSERGLGKPAEGKEAPLLVENQSAVPQLQMSEERNLWTKEAQFTPVSEEELDQMPLEEPATPWISWQTWLLAAGLLGIGGVVWYLLQPPSADALYERIVRAAQEGTIEALRSAEPAIQEFLSRYPSDLRAEQVRQYERELDLDRLERRFELHASGRLRLRQMLSPCERAYAEAVAISRSNPDLGMVKLRALLDLYEDRTDRSGPMGACLELARRRLQRLQEEVRERASGCLRVLEERLRRAEELDKSSPEAARGIRNAIVELYGDKPWAAAVVNRAKAALAPSAHQETSLPKSPPARSEKVIPTDKPAPSHAKPTKPK